MLKLFKSIFILNKKNIIFVFLLMILVSIPTTILPLILKKIIDDAIIGKSVYLLLKYSLYYIAIASIMEVSRIALQYILSVIKNNVVKYYKIQIIKKLKRINGNEADNLNIGEVLTVFNNDIQMLEDFGGDVIVNILSNIIISLISFIILVNMNLKLTLIISVIQICGYFIQIFISKKIQKHYLDVRIKEEEIANSFQEYLNNIKSIILSKLSGFFCDRFGKTVDLYMKKSVKLSLFHSLNVFEEGMLTTVSILIIYIIGGFNVINGKFSIGEIIAFEQYSFMFIGPCLSMIVYKSFFEEMRISNQRLNKIMSLDEISPNKIDEKEIENIKLENVSFHINEKYIFQNINMYFQKKLMYAIIGKNGSGKSTLIDILSGLKFNTSGVITFNETNIVKKHEINLKDNVYVSSQNDFIFSDSVYNNIVSDDSIRANKMCELRKIIDFNYLFSNFEKGINTIIGNNGSLISGGQRQIITIVRALLSEEDVIILDENFSEVDYEKKEYLFNKMREILTNKIVILITHDEYIVNSVDVVYEM
ncbi:ABC transporter transmembrane domain-containing protein [Peptostreptococcus faecalis]|uniref:ABC transporter transmembrane domain-containing protein n=1 Tax=Peptostreptococcus faecalis TaxID=2045015 RepID=UPI000C7AE6EC|nr:ABC transporter ATP-binding protein [Peptostreptococcus faecalis]